MYTIIIQDAGVGGYMLLNNEDESGIFKQK